MLLQSHKTRQKIVSMNDKKSACKMSMLVMFVKICTQLNHTSHLNTIFTKATGTCGFEKKQEQDTMCCLVGALACWLPFLLAQAFRNSFSLTLLCLCWGAEAFTWVCFCSSAWYMEAAHNGSSTLLPLNWHRFLCWVFVWGLVLFYPLKPQPQEPIHSQHHAGQWKKEASVLTKCQPM